MRGSLCWLVIGIGCSSGDRDTECVDLGRARQQLGTLFESARKSAEQGVSASDADLARYHCDTMVAALNRISGFLHGLDARLESRFAIDSKLTQESVSFAFQRQHLQCRDSAGITTTTNRPTDGSPSTSRERPNRVALLEWLELEKVELERSLHECRY